VNAGVDLQYGAHGLLLGIDWSGPYLGCIELLIFLIKK
jgi:hypothetical protein